VLIVEVADQGPGVAPEDGRACSCVLPVRMAPGLRRTAAQGSALPRARRSPAPTGARSSSWARTARAPLLDCPYRIGTKLQPAR